MASIRKLKSNRYQVQIRLKGFEPVFRSFNTRKDALNFVKAVEADTELLRKLGKAPALIPTFSEFVSKYMAQYSGKDPSTVGRLNWWCEQFGNQPLTKIDEFMVDDGLNRLSRSGLTGSTVNRYKSSLSAVFIYFIQHPDYKRTGYTNPVRKESVGRFRENPSKDRFLNQSEQQALLATCRVSNWPRLYLLVLMALTTGARKGELLNLRWQDVDLADRTAFLAMTKNGKPRKLPLTTNVVQELMKFRSLLTDRVFPASYITKDRSITELGAFDPKKPWVIALKAAGIQDCRFHDLRHTAASNLVKAGRTLFEVGILLGHSSPVMTQRYSHLAIEDTRSMVDKVMGGLA